MNEVGANTIAVFAATAVPTVGMLWGLHMAETGRRPGYLRPVVRAFSTISNSVDKALSFVRR